MSLNSTKYGLAFHTSSPDLGLAISNFTGDSRDQTWNLGQDLSTQLHSHLAAFLQPQTWSDLAWIAVAKGPGGFTGTRLGIIVARTLAQQLEIPLFTISSLAAVAHWHLTQNHTPNPTPQTLLAVQMPAQRGQLFTAIYATEPNPITAFHLTPILSDTVMTPEAWQQTLATGSTPYPLISVAGGLGKSVTSVLALAYLDWRQEKRPHWSAALPFYGQHPVQEKPEEKPVYGQMS